MLAESAALISARSLSRPFGRLSTTCSTHSRRSQSGLSRSAEYSSARNSSIGTVQSTCSSTEPSSRLECRVQFSNGCSVKCDTGKIIRRSSQSRSTT
ncbi:Uncharacterised protein [Mycobacterium tuberculosis]|nr:Uncharacterised protein [Mycobacterium tuberculosis]